MQIISVEYAKENRKRGVKMYWVYFRGTNNGEYITADSLKSAKWIFAIKHNVNSIAYIGGKAKKFSP
jgi:hypothetical protein